MGNLFLLHCITNIIINMRAMMILTFLLISITISETSEYDQDRDRRMERIQEMKQENLINKKVTGILYTLRQVESHNRYHVKGLSGEYGAYQFMPLTWQHYSIKYFDKVLDITCKHNQDKVAHAKVKDLVEQGYSHKEIASIWNSGTAEWSGRIGTNSSGVEYNVPNYVREFDNQFKTNFA